MYFIKRIFLVRYESDNVITIIIDLIPIILIIVVSCLSFLPGECGKEVYGLYRESLIFALYVFLMFY